MSDILWAEQRLALIESDNSNIISLKLSKQKAIEIFRYYIFQIREMQKGLDARN